MYATACLSVGARRVKISTFKYTYEPILARTKLHNTITLGWVGRCVPPARQGKVLWASGSANANILRMQNMGGVASSEFTAYDDLQTTPSNSIGIDIDNQEQNFIYLIQTP